MFCTNFRDSVRIHRIAENSDVCEREITSCDLDQVTLIILTYLFSGSGVFTTKFFKKGEFLLEYRGDYVGYSEALKREKNYKQCQGSFLFFFKDKRYGKKW